MNFLKRKKLKCNEITYTKGEEEINIEKAIKKFICQAPIFSCKSTAMRKWIYNTVPDNKFILAAPTINFAAEFYSKLYVALNNNHLENIDDMIKLSVKEGAFNWFKEAIKYHRTIYLYKLKNKMEGQRETIAKQVLEEIKMYDKILIKIEDKNE